jgi:polyphosphate kinase
MPSRRKRKYVNREISWLSFNERVLQEAADPRVPLMERVKFLGIFSSNQDEFFSVRVGTLTRMIDANVKPAAMIGGSPKSVLKKIQKQVLKLQSDFDSVFEDIVCELEKNNIFMVNETHLDEFQKAYLFNYFVNEVRPRLVPIMLDRSSGFPYLKNQVIYLAIHMYKQKDVSDYRYALIEVPADVLPRYLLLPSENGTKSVIILDDIIRLGLQNIFGIFNYDMIHAYTIKLTRDAELDIDDDITKSFFEKVAHSLEERKKGHPVRFVYDRKIPEPLLNFILRKNKLLHFENLIPGGRYHNARDFISFPDMGLKELKYEKRPPLQHPDIAERPGILATIGRKDVLLHFPYHSFSYIIDLLREAAIDPYVKSIKITLYRVAEKSNVINALINAIRNGKKVTVVMELQARFDEKANIYWTQKLEKEGATILDGVPGLKVHSKICLITRKEDGGDVHYATVGTGNFNESTAKIYSDHCLLTRDPRITEEVAAVFDFLEHNYKTCTYRHLLVSPYNLRKKFLRMIRAETRNAKAGKEAFIYAKMNSLVDRQMIENLYRASRVGVKIRMIVRGICSLIPDMSGLGGNIEVRSIVDKYLEHSRLFVFCNGGDNRYFLSSADWMVRNLDNRVEVAAPIYDVNIQQEIRDFLRLQFDDNTKARIINERQDNTYYDVHPENPVRAQEDIYDYLASRSRGGSR